MRLAALLSATAVAFAIPAAAVPAQEVDRVAINRIIDQGFNHSEVMETAAYLTDRIGGRMTNSPQMRQAEAWTAQRFRDWGLSNVRADPFEFGRGWSMVRASARMIEPRPLDLRVIPVAWTPGTDGGGAVALLEDVDLVDDSDPVWRRLVAEAIDPDAAGE